MKVYVLTEKDEEEQGAYDRITGVFASRLRAERFIERCEVNRDHLWNPEIHEFEVTQ